MGTVNKVLRGAARAGLSWPLEEEMSEEELQRRVFGEASSAPVDARRENLDSAAVYKEMQQRRHLTARLAWQECRDAHPDSYGYSQCCLLFAEWRGRRKVTMAQVHRAGETMYVDYAGTTARVYPRECEPWDAQIFRAVLGRVRTSTPRRAGDRTWNPGSART